MPGDEMLETGRSRALSLFFLSIIVFVVLIIRLFYLQLAKHDFYQGKSYDQRLRTFDLLPDRGDIFDREGNLLATSINAYSIYAKPVSVKDKKKTAEIISLILKTEKSAIISKLNSNKPFVWIMRKIEEPQAMKIIEKGLPGIGSLQEKKRVYPKKKLASQVLGFVGTDNQGLSGIEISYDRYLRGEQGRLIMEMDPSGRDIMTSSLRVLNSPTNGMNITLTVDENIQYKAEQEISKAVRKFNANSGCAIVMDIKSGDILALASYPDIDPNEYQRYKQDVWYSSVVKDVFEPGSTFKFVTVASAIEEGIITKNSKVNCPDKLELGGKVIKNSHTTKFNTHNLTVDEILRESVNTGAAEIAIQMGKEKFYKHIKQFGFGEYTGVGLAGESRGIIAEPSQWNKPDIGMISFGQSIAVTPIQLITSLASLANGGIRVKPRLVKKIESVDSNFIKIFAPEERGRVVSAKTAGDMMALSESVVENGTGRLAKIPGFRVGGKTGTAQKPKPGGLGYMPGHYVSSFIGFVPLDDPRIAVLVVVDDPKPVYWGERVASPAFKEIAEFTLRKLNVAPDKLAKSVI